MTPNGNEKIEKAAQVFLGLLLRVADEASDIKNTANSLYGDTLKVWIVNSLLNLLPILT